MSLKVSKLTHHAYEKSFRSSKISNRVLLNWSLESCLIRMYIIETNNMYRHVSRLLSPLFYIIFPIQLDENVFYTLLSISFWLAQLFNESTRTKLYIYIHKNEEKNPKTKLYQNRRYFFTFGQNVLWGSLTK